MLYIKMKVKCSQTSSIVDMFSMSYVFLKYNQSKIVLRPMFRLKNQGINELSL